MGDYFTQTFKKCIVGIAEAAIEGRKVSPSTEENCAVMAREAQKRAPEKPSPKEPSEKKPSSHHRHARNLQKLTAPSRPQSYKLFGENKSAAADFLKKGTLEVLKSGYFREDLQKIKPENREQMLKLLHSKNFFKLEDLQKYLQGGEQI